MVGVEVAKILIARLLEHDEKVKAYVLTFDGINDYGAVGILDYNLLNEELKTKWFQIYKDQVEVSHWSDFVQKFAKNHEDVLTTRERILIRMKTSDYDFGGEFCPSKIELFENISLLYATLNPF